MLRCPSAVAHRLSFGVLRFGLPQDGNVGVRVFPESEEILERAKCGIETSSSLEWDAIKVPVGGFFAESVAGAVRARRNGSLQHLRGDCM